MYSLSFCQYGISRCNSSRLCIVGGVLVCVAILVSELLSIAADAVVSDEGTSYKICTRISLFHVIMSIDNAY